MSAEATPSIPQGLRPGEKVTESGIILPAGVDRNKNVRETKSFGNLDARSDTYNAPGVDPENPYNFNAKEKSFKNEEVLLETDGLSLAEMQPRRARTNPETGVLEKLVKNADGSFEWASQGERMPGVQVAVLGEVASAIDKVELSAAEQVKEIASLKEELTAQAEHFNRIDEQLNKLAEKLGIASEDEPVNSAEDAPGKEIELFAKRLDDETPAIEAVEEIVDADIVDDNMTAEKSDENVEAAMSNIEVIISDEMQSALDAARDKYAEVTAKDRNGYIGHFLHSSKYLVKIPFAKKFADSINEKVDQKLNQAREEYKKAVYAIQVDAFNQILEQYGADNEDAHEKARIDASQIAINSEKSLELKIAAERIQRSGKYNKFLNWWVQQDGLGGKFKKAGLVAGVGLTAGVVAGLAGAPLIVGAVAGGALGAGIGAMVTKKRAGGLVEKGSDETLATRHGIEDLSQKITVAQGQLNNGEIVSVDSLSALTEERTAREKAGNRLRVKGAAGIGAAAGGFGGHLGSMAREGITNLFNTPAEAQAPAEVQTAPETPQAPAQPELQGTSFDVQSGSSYTQELMDFAQANGHALNPDQSWQLHQDLVNQFGGDYIDINGVGNDVYTDGGDFRLAEAGSGQWQDGVGQFIQQWMANRGLW